MTIPIRHRPFRRSIVFTILRLAIALGALFAFTFTNQPSSSAIQAEQKEDLVLRPAPQSVIFSVDFSPDGKRVALASEDKSISIYDWTTGKRLRQLIGHKERVWNAEYSPDGKLLASCDGEYFRPNDPGEVRIWDVKSGKAKATLKGHKGLVFDVAFSSDGKTLFSGDWNGVVKVWDVATGKERKLLQLHKAAVRTLVLSPDGKILASGGFDGQIRLHDARTIRLLRSWAAHSNGVQSISFTPDGQYLASCERPPRQGNKPGGIKIWSVASGKQTGLLTGSETTVLSLAFSRDGRMLASCGGYFSSFGEIKTFEIASGQLRAAIAKTKEWMECVQFSPDGKSVLSVGGFTRGVPGIIYHRFLLNLAPAPPPTATLSKQKRIQLWKALAVADAREAYLAMLELNASPNSAVELINSRLTSVKAIDAKKLNRWTRQLDNVKFVIRARAAAELRKAKDQARPVLYQLLATPTISAEARERATKLLQQVELPLDDGELLRHIRAVEVLEFIGSPAARTSLERLTKGAPSAHLTQHAKASLARLGRR